MLEPGNAAPPFRLASTSGDFVDSASLRGKRVVLYFYPRDMTPGCSQEARDFRDNIERLRQAGVTVFGVSGDSIESHHRFRSTFNLPFHLLSDPDQRVSSAYGAYGEKNMYGRPVTGTTRTTVLIDAQGTIEALWSPVQVAGHLDEIMAAVNGGSAPSTDSDVFAAPTIPIGGPPRARISDPVLVATAVERPAAKTVAPKKRAKKRVAKKAKKKPAKKKRTTKKRGTKKAAKKKPAKKKRTTKKRTKKKAAKKKAAKKKRTTKKRAKKKVAKKKRTTKKAAKKKRTTKKAAKKKRTTKKRATKKRRRR